MRWLVALGLAVGVAVAAVLVAALWWLPRFVNGDTVRHRVESAAREALGREVRYERLEVGWLPPSLVIVELRVAGDGPDGSPLLAAREVVLALELAPLLARDAVVDELVVEGAELRLVRTPTGLVLPPLGVGRLAPADAGEVGLSSLAVRRLELRDADVVFEDRTLAPTVTWRFPAARGSLREDAPGEPIEVLLVLELEGGGRLELRGRAGLDGRVELETRVEDFPIARLTPYLEAASRLEGLVSGTVSLRGPVSDPERVSVDLALADGALRIDPIEIVGRMTVVATLEGGLASPDGRFAVDATDSRVRYQDVFDKPPGRPATVEGRIVPGRGGGLDVEDVRLLVQDLEAGGRGRAGPGERLPAAPQVPVS